MGKGFLDTFREKPLRFREHLTHSGDVAGPPAHSRRKVDYSTIRHGGSDP
jgi:hypothetical protein